MADDGEEEEEEEEEALSADEALEEAVPSSVEDAETEDAELVVRD